MILDLYRKVVEYLKRILELNWKEIDRTTTAMAGGGTYLSSIYDISSFRELIIELYSDVAGSLNLYFMDTDNNKIKTIIWHYDGGVRQRFVHYARGKKFQIYYVNGATAQTTFRLVTEGRL